MGCSFKLVWLRSLKLEKGKDPRVRHIKVSLFEMQAPMSSFFNPQPRDTVTGKSSLLHFAKIRLSIK